MKHRRSDEIPGVHVRRDGGRENFSSLLEWPRLVRGNTRNKFSQLDSHSSGRELRNFRIFFGPRDGKLSPPLPFAPFDEA